MPGRWEDQYGSGGIRVDALDHALRTAALLRRVRPADKELQVAGLIRPVGRLLRPGAPAVWADRGADAVRMLLGEPVAAGFDAGVPEDWRTVLELLAARAARPGALG